MQGGGHAPHCVISHNPGEAKGCDHLRERCVGGDDSQSQTGGNTYGDRASGICPVRGRVGTFPLLVSDEEMEQFYQPNTPVYFTRGYEST